MAHWPGTLVFSEHAVGAGPRVHVLVHVHVLQLHGLSPNKMEPYQLDQLLLVKSTKEEAVRTAEGTRGGGIHLPRSAAAALFDSMQTMFILRCCSYAWHFHKHYGDFPHPAKPQDNKRRGGPLG